MENINTALADQLQALGHPGRIEIMRMIFAAGAQGIAAQDIAQALSIPNSTLSHHLDKLRRERLVDFRKDRQYLYYFANKQALSNLIGFLANDCCQGQCNCNISGASCGCTVCGCC